jgi:hypothetical protein
MQLTFDDAEKERLDDFVGMCEQFASHKTTPIEKLSYQYQVSFTGIGQSCVVTCIELDLSKDVTNYSSW